MKKTFCRLCQSNDLVEWLDLGFHPHSDQFRKTKDEAEVHYPLAVNQCQQCGFNQLSYVVDPTTLYTKDYLYESSITSTGDIHWTLFVEDVIQKTGIQNGTILDIGSNDGTLLLKFKKKGFNIHGIDPCPDIGTIANMRGVPTIIDFFCANAIRTLPKMNLITGSNVFAHIDDLNEMVKNIANLLSTNGVFVFESPYFGNFLRGLEYDTVYHQHLSYLSLKPLIPFFAKHGLEVFDITMSEIHGGSFRVFIAPIGTRVVQPIVRNVCDAEDFSLSTLLIFARRVFRHRLELTGLINGLKAEGRSIVAVSAPAKGMTLLNYTHIGKYLDFITEKSKLKIGRYTPGSHIQIVPDSTLIEVQPDYAILLAWNFAEEIIRNNSGYKGKWIIPLPVITIR